MNRTVLYASFHSPVFVAGLNVGNDLDATQATSKWKNCNMKCDSVGVYVKLQPAGRPTPSELFVPWPNVKSVRLAPEDPEPSKAVLKVA